MQRTHNKVSFVNEASRPSPFLVDLKDSTNEPENINISFSWKQRIREFFIHKNRENTDRTMESGLKRMSKNHRTINNDLNLLSAFAGHRGGERKIDQDNIDDPGYSFGPGLSKESYRRLFIYPIIIVIFRIIFYLSRPLTLLGRLIYYPLKQIARITGEKSTSQPGQAAFYGRKSIPNIEKPSMPEDNSPDSAEEPLPQAEEPAITGKGSAELTALSELLFDNESFARPRRMKPIFVLAVIMFLIILPLKGISLYPSLRDWQGRVLGVTESAAQELIRGGDLLKQEDFTAAIDRFSAAQNGFHEVSRQISLISKAASFIGELLPSDKLRLADTADDIALSGELSARIAGRLGETLSMIDQHGNELPALLPEFEKQVLELKVLAGQLLEASEGIDENAIPDEYKAQIKLLKAAAQQSVLGIDRLYAVISLAGEMAGFDYDRRYLAVFQNNTEMRGSGGFIGSYALIDIRNGQVQSWEAPGGGSYDTEGGLSALVKAPEPLWLVNPLWHFWDANWWPDWRMSAQKLMWFLEKSGGPTVDGVIALTPTVMERILTAIGPIDLDSEEYGVTLTAENFWPIVQSITEAKPPAAAATSSLATTTEPAKLAPKKIIGDLIEKIMAVLPERLNSQTMLSLMSALESSLVEKQVLLYAPDQSIEQKICSLGWGGEVIDTSGDYLMVVNSNIAGGKTDKVIKNDYKLESSINANGEILNRLSVVRAHSGVKGDEFTGVRNVNWLRVYVPLGSELVSASGFRPPDESFIENPDQDWQEDPELMAGEDRPGQNSGDAKIYEENGKTVFAGWTMVDPGQTETTVFTYKIPFSIKAGEPDGNTANPPAEANKYSHSLLVQKQPGATNTGFSYSLALPNGLEPTWIYGGLKPVAASLTADRSLDKDFILAAEFEHRP